MCVVCVVCDGDARAGAFGVAARARRRLMVDGTARSNGERRARARRPKEATRTSLSLMGLRVCFMCAQPRGGVARPGCVYVRCDMTAALF